jgi:uncharacterized heparinase superfamily protein
VRPARLLTMGIPELVVRGRQEASKWLDRAASGARTVAGPRAALRAVGPAWVPAPERFFEGARSDATPILLAERWPSAHAEIVASAEAICRKRFDLLGHRQLFFGDPVNWHLDPVSGRRAPLDHWSRLDPLDPAQVGDVKIIWELNRHQWLVRLGQAYRLTGEARYAEAFASFVREWVRANPYGIGINWASSLEVALRLIAWCWALVHFRGSAALSSDLLAEMVSGIRTHACHIERFLSHYFSPNTHLTGEALGLFYAGVVFPEPRAAARWREAGARILVRQIERQVLPDGVHFELSTCYHRYTMEIYLHFLILARRNGVPIPAHVSELVRRMADFLLAVRRPDGSIPEIGDADGGWLLPFVPREPDDARGVLSVAAALFGSPDHAWAAGEAAPELLWLLGSDGLAAFDALRPAPPAPGPSLLFPEGGYAVMRSGWETDAHHLIFDVGPLGCPVSAGHGHADLLGIQCSTFGDPLLVDTGTFCYTSDPSWRDFFRGTSAHSTVTVDGASQAAPAGSFAWKNRPKVRLRRWQSTETFDFADAEHDGYRRLRDPVVHRRRVLFVKPRYWVVVDDLDGSDRHRVELRFQFAPLRVTLDADLWARAHRPGGSGLLLRPFTTVPLEGGLHEGNLDPIQGWLSLHYGRRQPAPVLVYSAVARLPLRVVTLLLPVREPSPAPVVSALEGGGPGPDGLLFEASRETVRFDADGFSMGRG